MAEIKLIFTGNEGVGKTSAIAAISEIEAVNYGELTLKNHDKLRMYAVSGQQYTDYLIKGLVGLVILINNAGTDPVGDLARQVDSFRELISKVITVIGVTHLDVAPEPALQSYSAYLTDLNIKLPIVAVDARSSESVMALVQLFQQDEPPN